MHRYEIKTSKELDPRDTHLLQRAFVRAAIRRGDVVKRIEVSGPDGSFAIVMDVVGPPGRVVRECERLFAAAWYDAFGPRGNTHIGWLVENQSSPRPRRSRAA